jgi:hypothetical protein
VTVIKTSDAVDKSLPGSSEVEQAVADDEPYVPTRYGSVRVMKGYSGDAEAAAKPWAGRKGDA